MVFFAVSLMDHLVSLHAVGELLEKERFCFAVSSDTQRGNNEILVYFPPFFFILFPFINTFFKNLN